MRRLLTTLALLLLPVFAFAGAVPDKAEDAQPLAVGSKLPDSAIQLLDGQETSLLSALGQKPAVIVFYRGGWCPFCNRQLSELRLIQEDLRALGYQIVAVSPDSPEALRQGLKKTPVEYTLLSDGSASLIRDLGIAFKVDDKTVEKYRGYGIDLAQASGHDHHLLPIPTVIVADAAGVIRHLDANADYKIRPSNEEVLAAAKKHSRPEHLLRE